MYESFLIAGFGGQGIMFSGKLLAYAGLKEGKKVTYFPSYGAEMRGGTANCTVIISNSLISSPVVSYPLNAIIMSQPSMEKFFFRIARKGKVVINTSLVKSRFKRDDLDIIEIPANEIAEKIGDIRIANMVALGALMGKLGILSLEALTHSLKEVISRDKMDLFSLNEQALREGDKFVREVS